MIPEITHKLHDSTIISVSTGPRREVAFVVDLYPIFYPAKPRIILRFGEILNYEKVSEYVRKIESEADEDYIGCRIDAFQYDTKKASQANDYWFFFETAWSGPLRIHCSQMTIREIDAREAVDGDLH